MEGLINYIPQLLGILDKGGTIGVLVIAAVFLYMERAKKIAELNSTYRERDRERLVSERYRSALAAHNIPIPDISDIEKLYEKRKEEK